MLFYAMWITARAIRGLPLLLPLALLIVGCSSGKESGGDAGANLLVNPGFEQGADPWHTMTGDAWSQTFDVADTAHSGVHSVHVQLTPPDQPLPNKVFGVTQDITQMPEYVSGYYRVENWQKATPAQYLQFVVIVFTTDPNTGQQTNVQIRYLLAGASEEPFRIDNAKFIFIDKSEPVTGQWVHFGRNVKQDFQSVWGYVPQNVTSVRVFFEARYDSPTAIQPQIGGDVYYDDLYAGPESKAPKS